MIALLLVSCSSLNAVSECGWVAAQNLTITSYPNACMRVRAGSDGLAAPKGDNPCDYSAGNCIIVGPSTTVIPYGSGLTDYPRFVTTDADLNDDGTCPLTCP